MTTLSPIAASDLKRKLDAGEAILIDIREHAEHAAEHIVGARLAPLSAIDTHDFDRDHDKIAVFHCRSGMRTQTNAARLLAKGFREAHFLDGGIEAWKAAGYAVHRGAKRPPIDLMRQVQIAAGSLVLVGVALGLTVNPALFGVAAFVGAGLTFAGASGWCGMARLLALMPWNRAA
jgi:rhodanese-related sulfurtransferase